MRIGIDFDNTIVSYDSIFYKVAVEQGAVPSGIAASKLGVRDYLRGIGQEDVWTEMQGYVYGPRMAEAAAFPGAIELLQWAKGQGFEVSIISHKTLHPYRGPQYHLHEAARRWVAATLGEQGENVVGRDQVFFELTKEAKLARIARAQCDCYIDDLPEILLADAFPSATVPILFDPEASYPDTGRLLRMTSWDEILAYFRQQCPTNP